MTRLPEDWLKLNPPASDSELDELRKIHQSPEHLLTSVVLSDGRVCDIYPHLLWHGSLIQSSDQYQMVAKLLSLTCLVEGKARAAQYYYELPVRDVDKILSAFSEAQKGVPK